MSCDLANSPACVVTKAGHSFDAFAHEIIRPRRSLAHRPD